jgi:methylated-DNA-[protein]-cysteine S-methyltransferase
VIAQAQVESPIGPLIVAAREGRVCLLHFGADDERVRRWLGRWYPAEAVEEHRDPAGAVSVLSRYFDGDVNAIDAIPVEMNGTAFQQRVWTALRGVHAGRTASYAQIAREIGASSAVRAVGTANGANPVALVVPCHRVIGSNGSLTGYGGGLERKQWLLRHEGVGGFRF